MTPHPEGGGMTGAGVRVLPADVWDALEFSAFRFGGIGEPAVLEFYKPEQPPFCIFGHAIYVTDATLNEMYTNPVGAALRAAGVSGGDSDRAVDAINRRRGARPFSRVPFTAWAAELGVTRGD